MIAGIAGLRARRSGWPWFLPTATFVLIWFVEQTRSRSVPLWVDVGHSLETSLLLMGPLVAASTALQTVREERLPLRELLDSTPRKPISRAISLVAGELTWAWAAYIGVGAWLLFATALGAGPGFPDLELVAAGLAGSILFACSGFTAARVIPHYIVCPIVAVGLYFTIWAVGVGETPLRNLSPLIDGEPTPLLPYPPSLGLLHLVWFLALGVALLLVGVLWRDFSRRLAIILAGSLTASVLAGIALVSIGSVYDESVGIDYGPQCRIAQGIEVCIHPAFENVVEPASELAVRSVRPVYEATGWPTRLLQVGIRDDAARAEKRGLTTLAFSASPVGVDGFEPDGLVQGIAGALVGFDRCDDLNPDDPVRIGLAVWLIHTVRPESIETNDFPFAVWFENLSDTRQSAWWRTHIDALRTCTTIEPPSFD